MINTLLETNETTTLLLKMRRNIAQMILAGQNQTLSPDQLAQVQEFYQEALGVNLTAVQIQAVIDSYPYAKVSLIRFSINDTEVKTALADALSLLVTGYKYPTPQEVSNLEKYWALLQAQTKLVFP